jgi:MFS family permease
MIWSAIFTIGVAIQTATMKSIPQISTGRFIAGLGVGAMSAIVPLYNGESSPKAIRGMLIVVYQVQIITGYFLSQTALHTLSSLSTVFSYLMSSTSVHILSKTLHHGVYQLGCKWSGVSFFYSGFYFCLSRRTYFMVYSVMTAECLLH